MQITSSLDWPDISSQLRKIGRSAVQQPRHLSVYLDNLNNQVKQLGNMEVDFRRTKRPPNQQYKELLAKVNESITELEMLLMVAALGK
jgi:hypothetical protein